MTTTPFDFRTFRASAPVVRVGEEHSDFCFFVLDLGNGEYFVFRDVIAHIEQMEPEKAISIQNASGVRGLFRCIVERKVVRPQAPTDFPMRLPSFGEWWDGTDEELHALMLLLVTSEHAVTDALDNAARAVKTAAVADRIIADSRFPASTHFTALRATETDVLIELLCEYVNAHGGYAHELYTRLEHADPLIQLLERRGELERIRPAIEQIPKMFEWRNGLSGRTHILKALQVLTGITP